MLSEILYRRKTIYSLIFCVVFSIGSMIWKGNGLSQFIVSVKNTGTRISSSFGEIGDWFSDIWRSLEDYQNVVSERDLLQKNLKQQATLYSRYRELLSENKRLRDELKFEPRMNYKSLKAEVLAVRLSSIYRTIIIDKGSDQGIRPFMPVVARAIFKGRNANGQMQKYFIEGLVGKVISVQSSSAVVQPIVNAQFQCGVRIPNTRLWATLDGNSDRSMFPRLKYISSFVTLGSDKQDLPVVTSGKAGVFPPGIPIGRLVGRGEDGRVSISHGGFKTAYVEPFVQIELLDTVSVILKNPDAWAEHWPENKPVMAGSPDFSDAKLPDKTSGELPGTGTYVANIPNILIIKEEAKQKTLAKQKKTKKPDKKKNTPVKTPGNTEPEDEFSNTFIEEPESSPEEVQNLGVNEDNDSGGGSTPSTQPEAEPPGGSTGNDGGSSGGSTESPGAGSTPGGGAIVPLPEDPDLDEEGI